jgi:hypothetical protein
VKKDDDLIYSLIFSEQESFIIDISDYITDIYQYTEFVSMIKNVLKKSKVKISKSNIAMDSKTVLWELKVKK